MMMMMMMKMKKISRQSSHLFPLIEEPENQHKLNEKESSSSRSSELNAGVSLLMLPAAW